MANIVITSANGFLQIVFGDSSIRKEIYINKNNIAEIELLPDGGVYIVKNYNSIEPGYKLSFDGKNGEQVDSVQGANSLSDSELRDKILALITT